MKACGKRFHSEVGKFRFLNELIKVVSPKVRRMRMHTDAHRHSRGKTHARTSTHAHSYVDTLCSV